MKRREFIKLLGGAAASLPFKAHAQQPSMPVIGFLSLRSAKDSAINVAAFAKGLEEAGFVEGRNLSIEHRFAEGQLDHLPALAADLVQRQVAVLVTVGGTNAALVAKKATSTIPIVFVIGGDPVELGLSSSLSRPDSNATGMTIISGPLAQKRLGLLRELVPNATAFAALMNSNTPQGEVALSDVRAAAQSLGLNLRILEASDEKGIEKAFATLAQDKVDALLVGTDAIFDVHVDRLVALVAAAALPAIYQFRDFATAGGLMSYDPDIAEAYRQVGVYTGKILKGARPVDLPIQQPTRFNFVLNLKTAKALGITVPPSLLARADEVIE